MSSQCFGLYNTENNIVGFLAVIHFPHPKNKKLKRAHRLVILPDYQGVGLGTRFLTCVADMYKRKGFDFRITTTAKNLVDSLQRRNNWECVFYGRSKLGKSIYKSIARSMRKVTVTQFMYTGQKAVKVED